MLIMVKERLLSYPVIYPSEYFDRNRDEYIDKLFGVSSADRFEEWLNFFIGAMKEQADGSVRMIDGLRDYRRQLDPLCENLVERKLLDLLFRNPYVRTVDVTAYCGVSVPTAMKAIAKLESEGVLREVSGRKRNKLYLADGVLDILMRR